MAKILANTKDMSLSEWRQLRKKSIGGSDAATIKSYSKSSIDSKGLKKELPDVFNNFSKTTYYKKMTIKEAK